ncbi:hypothetical protein SDC9_203676 [bioreactor metagenome]|uniref:Uncharacterized protein n=1 Tax=bioreactor metagenome TaxID=1076179 RepID=A0A645IYQ8_9ZZZZ
MVERPLGHPGRSQNLVQPDTGKALAGNDALDLCSCIIQQGFELFFPFLCIPELGNRDGHAGKYLPFHLDGDCHTLDAGG